MQGIASRPDRSDRHGGMRYYDAGRAWGSPLGVRRRSSRQVRVDKPLPDHAGGNLTHQIGRIQFPQVLTGGHPIHVPLLVLRAEMVVGAVVYALDK